MPLPTIDIGRVQVSSHIRRSLARVFERHADLCAFVEFLSQFGKAVVFGGFVRDAIHNLLHADVREFRDIDLIVVGELEGSHRASRNHFGGFRRAFTDGLKVDYWTLASTFAFSAGLYKCSLENLPLTTVFTINACLFDPSTGQLLEHGAIEAIASRRISFNCKDYLDVYPDFQAFRAVDFSERLRYALDPEVHEFVGRTLSRASREAFIEAVLEHRPTELPSRLNAMFESYRKTS